MTTFQSIRTRQVHQVIICEDVAMTIRRQKHVENMPDGFSVDQGLEWVYMLTLNPGSDLLHFSVVMRL